MKTNYHTHTCFCDGADNPEQMVKEAISRGIQVLGFSAHSMYPLSSEYSLPLERHTAYRNEITRLKKEYSGKIEILLGYEAEYFPPAALPDKSLFASIGAEYIIASLHFLTAQQTGISPSKIMPGTRQWFAVDGRPEAVQKGIDTLCGGSGKRAVQIYFAVQREMMELCSFDIIGHIDLIRRRNAVLRFFDESEPWYLRELKATAKAAAHSGAVVEVNTGGMARKSCATPYPSPDFLRLLSAYDVPIQINSDAHNAKDIDFAFDTALKYIKKAGFRQITYISQGQYRVSPLT